MAASRSNAACAHPDEHCGKRRSEDPPPPRRCAGSALGSPYPGRPTAAHSTHRQREPRQRPQPTFGNAEEETRTGTSVSGTRRAVGPGTPRVDTRHARLRASRAGGCPTIPRGAVGSTADDDHRPWGKRPARTPLRRRQRRSRATGIACVVVMPRPIHPPPRVRAELRPSGRGDADIADTATRPARACAGPRRTFFVARSRADVLVNAIGWGSKQGSPGEHRASGLGHEYSAQRISERIKAPESSWRCRRTTGGHDLAVTRGPLLGRETLWRAGIGEDARRRRRHASSVRRNPMNLMVGCGTQQARDSIGGENRRGREERRGRNEHGAWQRPCRSGRKLAGVDTNGTRRRGGL